jgi:DNA-binding NarL/FixJ family response regulator
MNIVIVTTQPNNFQGFAKALKFNPQVRIQWAATRAEAIEVASEASSDLMIVDAQVEDMSGMDLVRELIMVNAGIHLAVVSGLPAEEFHEAGEGLGIMAQVTPNPDASAAKDLLSLFERLKKELLPFEKF